MPTRSREYRPELGRGWAFPVRIVGGRFAMSHGVEKVKESVRVVLGTSRGERIMRDDFGSNVKNLLLEPLTPVTAERLADAIRTALTRWEPRVDVLEVSVSPDAVEETKLVASLTYRLKEHNTVFNQVYDFYLTEGVEEVP